MNTYLKPVDIKEKKTLGDLIEEYQKEILKIEKIEKYKYLDSYWQDPDSHPFFIEVDNTIAGFVLINNYCLIEKDAKSISEFYVKKEFRNKEIGKLSAFRAFDLFRGKWEIRELNSNIPAQDFWLKVIGEYTNGNFKKIILNNKDWHGPVQIFNNNKSS